MLTEWLPKKSCLIWDLMSLVCKLQHAIKVVQPGRTFLCKMFELLKGRLKGQWFIHFSAAFRSDLMWWHVFLESWNRVGLLQGWLDGVLDFNLFTDVSQALLGQGLGLMCPGFNYHDHRQCFRVNDQLQLKN